IWGTWRGDRLCRAWRRLRWRSLFRGDAFRRHGLWQSLLGRGADRRHPLHGPSLWRPQSRGSLVERGARRPGAGTTRRQRWPICNRIGPSARGGWTTRRPSGPRRVRQPRHCQRRLALAVRVLALSRPVLRIALVAVVEWRSRHWLGRTAVLALFRL